MQLTETNRCYSRMPDSMMNHSIRDYTNEKGEIVMLDRNNSFEPPVFKLSKPYPTSLRGIIPIEDENFCEGKSWKFAEKTMRELYKNA